MIEVPAREERAQQRLERFGAVSQLVGGDFDMPVLLNEEGQGSHWDFEHNHIMLDGRDVRASSARALRALAIHEGTHRRIFDPACLPHALHGERGFMFMINAVEDCRGNNFALAYCAPFREDAKHLYTQGGARCLDCQEQWERILGFQPRHMQVGFEFIRHWFTESRGQQYVIPSGLCPEVTECLERTLCACRRSSLHFPSIDEVEESGQKARQYCAASMAINIAEIWPEFKKLVDLDYRDAAASALLTDMHEGQGPFAGGITRDDVLTPAEWLAVERSVGSGPVRFDRVDEDIREKLRRFLAKQNSHVRAHYEDRAEENFRHANREWVDLPRAPLQPQSLDTDFGPAAKGVRSDYQEEESGGASDKSDTTPPIGQDSKARSSHTPRGKNRYYRYRDSLAHLTRTLSAALDAALSVNDDHSRQDGFSSGSRLNVGRRVREVARGVPAANTKAMRRSVGTQEKEYAFYLLIDLSSSMQGDSVRNAQKAAIVLCEALKKQMIPFGVAGFHSEFFELKGVHESLSADVCLRVGTMHSKLGDSTDTGWAVESALGRLMATDAAQKILIVVTDGGESPSAAHAQESQRLPAVLARAPRLFAPEQPIIVGVGIGKGAEPVARCFPNSVVEEDVGKFPRALSKLMTRVISQNSLFR